MRPATSRGWEAVNNAYRAVKDYALHDQVVAAMWTVGAVLSVLREKSKDTSEAARGLVTISPMPPCTGFSAKDSGSSDSSGSPLRVAERLLSQRRLTEEVRAAMKGR